MLRYCFTDNQITQFSYFDTLILLCSAKLLRKVKRMEKDHKIVERWTKEDAHYKENLAAAIKQRRKSVLQECQLVLQDRAFLFNLKKTHAGENLMLMLTAMLGVFLHNINLYSL